MKGFSRRTFLSTLSAVGVGSFLPGSAVGQSASEERTEPVCIFSKHLQWLGYAEMAEFAASIGFDGVDLTVRPGGHVEPEQVERDLAVAHAAITAAGLTVPLMTTSITDPDDALSERVLATASELGISHYRMGYYRYRESESVDTTLLNVRRKMSELARLNEKHGIVGDYQNHAGRDYFGASLWDLWYVLRDLDSEWIGCQFDLRHATVEGALNWPVDFRRISASIHSLVAKSFNWEIGEGKSRAVNVPLGQGIADFKTLFELSEKYGVAGPISLHLEYPLGGANRGAQELSVPRSSVESAMRRDLATLRSLLALKR